MFARGALDVFDDLLPGLFVVFLIVHSSVVTMSNKPSLSKSHYLDPQALTSDSIGRDVHERPLRAGHASHVAVRPRLFKARFLRIAAVGMADGESRLSTLHGL